MTRLAWCAALKPNVSGIATNVVLFSQHGARLVHHYRVYGEYVSHSSLRGTFMAKLSEFMNRACAEARSVAKRGRDSSTESVRRRVVRHRHPSSLTHRTADHDPPARKAARAVASASHPSSLTHRTADHDPPARKAARAVAPATSPLEPYSPHGRPRPSGPESCTGCGVCYVTPRALLTARQTTTLRPRKLHGLWCLLRHPSSLTHRTADHDPPGPESCTICGVCYVTPRALLTARQTTTLRPGKLHGLWRLLRHLMTPSFPLCRCHRCPSDLCAHFHQTGVAAATAFRHTRYHSDTGTRTATIPAIPIVTGVTVIDPLL